MVLSWKGFTLITFGTGKYFLGLNLKRCRKHLSHKLNM